MTHPTPKELIVQVREALNRTNTFANRFTGNEALDQLSTLFEATEVSARELAERLSSYEFISLECLTSANQHKYSYDIESATALIQSQLIAAKKPDCQYECEAEEGVYEKKCAELIAAAGKREDVK